MHGILLSIAHPLSFADYVTTESVQVVCTPHQVTDWMTISQELTTGSRFIAHLMTMVAMWPTATPTELVGLSVLDTDKKPSDANLEAFALLLPMAR